MYVDPITFVLKPNDTLIRIGTYLPIKKKICNTWYCKHCKWTACGAPSKFEPVRDEIGNLLEYNDLPLEGGMFTKHEKSIFYEDSRRKALAELGDDIVNLRHSKLYMSS